VGKKVLAVVDPDDRYGQEGMIRGLHLKYGGPDGNVRLNGIGRPNRWRTCLKVEWGGGEKSVVLDVSCGS